MKKAFIAIVTLILFSSLASAQFETGNTLLFKLQQFDPSGKQDFTTLEEGYDAAIDHVHAVGYVCEVYDVFVGNLWESPPNIVQRQLADIAIKYLKAHPEERHQNATKLVIRAFLEAFPLDQK